MIDELREETIIAKAGGRFKLTTLIRKRLVHLRQGSRPRVQIESKDAMEIVVAEIMQDKIYLDTNLNVQYGAGADPHGPLDLTGGGM